MKLHLDRAAFEFIIDKTAKTNGVRRDVLEKDYYVTLLLCELSQKESQGYAYFKGGTALYKALRSIRRFSEDIDLTVFTEDCPTNSQAQKRLENAALKFKSMRKEETLENRRGSITCLYSYDSLYDLDVTDALQRFGNVKVEATSFTVSEPTEKIEIAPHLYELCDETQKNVLREQYDIEPFMIETISLERIFIDKVFAAEFYYIRNEFSDVAKHVYDLTVLLQNDRIIKFLADKAAVQKIVALKRREELSRKGGVDSTEEIVNFRYFIGLKDNKEFEAKFFDMQKVYVLDEKDILTLEEVMTSIQALRNTLDIEW